MLKIKYLSRSPLQNTSPSARKEAVLLNINTIIQATQWYFLGKSLCTVASIKKQAFVNRCCMYRPDETHSNSVEFWEGLSIEEKAVVFVDVMTLDLTYVNTTKKRKVNNKQRIHRKKSHSNPSTCLPVDPRSVWDPRQADKSKSEIETYLVLSWSNDGFRERLASEELICPYFPSSYLLQ